MKKTLIITLLITLILLGLVGGYFWLKNNSANISFVSPLTSQTQEKVKPLDKYSFENLKNAQVEPSEIKIEETIEETKTYTSYLFSYIAEGKKITGQINIPTAKKPKSGFPVILMLRGYIPPETYETGDGTRNAAKVFAQNGFVTIAPDFLGHGGSDYPDINTIAARVKRPYNLLVLLSSLKSLSQISISNLGIWGHSNGGQLALTMLEITGLKIPATLWAPVSKPFPYSILYYTDEYDDYGKALRRVIADFEKDYDVDKYSIHKYYDWIKAVVQIHQGTNDDAIPLEWTNDLVSALKDLELEVNYYKYPGADHNMRPSWDLVINRDVNFFNSHLK